MNRPTPTLKIVRIATAVALVILLGLRQNACSADEHWVTTWGCGPQLTEERNLPPVALAENTLRQFVLSSIGGKVVRVRLSNLYGTAPVTIDSARIALAAGAGSAGSAGSGEIDPATDTALLFHGATKAVIPPGEEVYSDLVTFDLPAVKEVGLSLHLGQISPTTICGHPGSRTTSFIQTGNAASKGDLPGATKTDHWYLITGIEVMADMSSHAIIAFGDSITDGRGSTTNGNTRWPDYLAARFVANASTSKIAVANMGIGGNGVFGGLGPSGQDRFQRDVLAQNGARWVILFIGVNDIGGAADGSGEAIAQKLIAVFTTFAQQAHVRNIRVWGATITPFGGSSYDTADHESARQIVNQWIRTNKVYDACIDFDAVVRDPENPVALLPTYSSDNLHMTPAGYQAMANSIDPKLFDQ
jgi:lysophospholipase L1-like esterase